ncbi:metal-dependent phosphohydrolase [Marinobacterium nitratireducens]|uniref:Metal-dependent phosphohydrolase n=1 Tax=Marinobacterium nitratireducens TaxID=518897 RepID=A0A917Z5L3_9GAMM|nr:HD domain-containing phosphohydrolase [Marinobacterium nitratireducens]GGO75739.1 metal-dependent phosphohydrolase [Marinobacterium nitratireducens]
MIASLNHRRYPLHLQIATVFVALISVLGGLLSWYNYHKTSDIILEASSQLFDQFNARIEVDFIRAYEPIVQTIQLLTLEKQLIESRDLDSRLQKAPLFGMILRQKPQVTGLAVAYNNGDYFIMRPTTTEHMRGIFNAPDNAVAMADNIQSAADGSRRIDRFYFDENFALLARTDAGPSDYDPRLRPWYQQAMASDRQIGTQPYFYRFIQQVGITLAIRTPDQSAIIAADVSLDILSDSISQVTITPSSEVVLLDSQRNAVAYRDPSKLIIRGDNDAVELADLDSLGSDVLRAAAPQVRADDSTFTLDYNDDRWYGRVNLLGDGQMGFHLLTLVPESELLGAALAMRRQSLIITAILLLCAIPLTWTLAQKISRPLRQLSREATAISHFQLDQPLGLRSVISEIDDLSSSMGVMKDTLNRFLGLLRSITEETKFGPLIELIGDETRAASQADGSAIFLVGEDEQTLEAASLRMPEQAVGQGSLRHCSLNGTSQLARCVQQQETLLETVSRDTPEHPLFPLLKALQHDSINVAAIPLLNRKREAVGVLCLLFEDLSVREDSNRLAFIEALSGFASITLESRQLIRMEKALLEAFIELIASAIDAKSPHTGGHCQRVPTLTKMLARAACESDAPEFRQFRLNTEQWEELHIASWLHDCGKVTTPEYVVDKATKLETLYDRIHEIRTRFEVLKRDAEIRYWKARYGGGDDSTLRSELERELQTLDDDFAFIANCNLGGEYMEPDDQARLHRIADRTWLRTLDDSLGISWEERQRRGAAREPLPVEEKLLADKPVHIVKRAEGDCYGPDNPWGFRLDTPEHLYNRGELYNLQIPAGTLTAEERYKINDHIVQTIIMLEKLPYPRHLRRVPEIAGGHHERMDGNGYPKRLRGEEMSQAARMMAIADVFEALTAADRPYKEAKSLSQSLRIMASMRDGGHLDPDLLRLFLESGVYLRYAERYLDPKQIDEVHIEDYLGAEVH